MPEVEGIGEVATGAALARAVEPRTGEVDGHTQEANCLNCGDWMVHSPTGNSKLLMNMRRLDAPDRAGRIVLG